MSISKVGFFEICGAISAFKTALATILKRATVAFFGASGSAAIRHVRRSTFTAACMVARRHFSVGPSVLWQPAQQRFPAINLYAITAWVARPSAVIAWLFAMALPSQKHPTVVAFATTAWRSCTSLAPSPLGLSVRWRSAHHSLLAQVLKMQHTGAQSHQTSGAVSVANVGALTPNSVQFGGISSTVAPCLGLTYWSRGRLYLRSFRQSHAGAPYRGR